MLKVPKFATMWRVGESVDVVVTDAETIEGHNGAVFYDDLDEEARKCQFFRRVLGGTEDVEDITVFHNTFRGSDMWGRASDFVVERGYHLC